MELFKPGSIHIDFMGKRRFFCAMSIVLVLASIAVFVAKQATGTINWGIDFAGGTLVELAFDKEVPIADVRRVVEELGYHKNVIQQGAFVGKEGQHEYMIRVERIAILSPSDSKSLEETIRQKLGDRLIEYSFNADDGDQFNLRLTEPLPDEEIKGLMSAQAEALRKPELAEVTLRKIDRDGQQQVSVLMTGVGAQIEQAMQKAFPDALPILRKVEFVGPQVGNKLRNDGILALIFANLGILVYVAFRFNLLFAPGAVIALIHDAAITIGIFALFGLEFNLTFVAAVLTIIGYSVNDTIVIYDRVRENMARIRNQPLEKVINVALNETLARTILTSLATWLSLVGILLVGFGEILDFAIAMTIGIVVGTYSSIYIASALTVWFEQLSLKFKKA